MAQKHVTVIQSLQNTLTLHEIKRTGMIYFLRTNKLYLIVHPWASEDWNRKTHFFLLSFFPSQHPKILVITSLNTNFLTSQTSMSHFRLRLIPIQSVIQKKKLRVQAYTVEVFVSHAKHDHKCMMEAVNCLEDYIPYQMHSVSKKDFNNGAAIMVKYHIELRTPQQMHSLL